VRKEVLRGLFALVGAVAAGGIVSATTARPPATAVVTLKTAVPAGQVITAADVGSLTIQAHTAPVGIATAASQIVGQIAQIPLAAGQTVALTDVAHTYLGVPAGRVKLVLSVNAAQSALVAPGDWVDIWGTVTTNGSGSTKPVTTVLVLASHVPVLGVYTSNGQPVVTTGANAAAPGLVSVAVTPAQLNTLLPYVASTQSGTFWLTLDPSHVVP